MAASQTPQQVVVVGAGIVGAAIAYFLTLHDVQVTLLDASAPGEGTSRVSFAWLNAYGKSPFAYHQLNRRAMDLWHGFAARLGGDLDLTWGGELRWAVTAAGAQELAARARTLQAWGYPTRLIDVKTLRALEPELPVAQPTAVSYSRLDGHVEVTKAVQACLRAAVARGARCLPYTAATALALTRRGGTQVVEAVITHTGAFPCDAAVLACGADTPALAATAGVEVPLYHTFGATLLTSPLPRLFRTVAVLHSPRDRQPRLNVRQLADGRVMLQSNAGDNRSHGDRGATDAEAAQILAEAQALLPALAEARLAEVRRGRRPLPRDGFPIVGFAPTVPNLYLAVTHSGVTLAPLLGELAALEIAEGVRVAPLAPFRLERFGAPRVRPQPGSAAASTHIGRAPSE